MGVDHSVASSESFGSITNSPGELEAEQTHVTLTLTPVFAIAKFAFRPDNSCMATTDLDCFILSRQWRDEREGLELVYWARSDSGPVRIGLTRQEAVCFVERDVDLTGIVPGSSRREPLTLRSLETGREVDGLYFQRQRDLLAARNQLLGTGKRLLESDIKPSDRFLMERFITAACTVRGEVLDRGKYLVLINPKLRAARYLPRLSVTSIDIETDGLDGPLFSIAVSNADEEAVFMVDPGRELQASPRLTPYRSESELLEGFFAWLSDRDPDVLIGWNVVNFDLDYLEKRSRALGVSFDVGRGGERATVLQPRTNAGMKVARVPGRVVLDGIELLRAAFWNFENFELETVAQELLGHGKRIEGPYDRVEEIRRLYAEDKAALAAYNLEDCRLVREIFDKAQLLGFALRRSELTGLAIDRLGGSVAAFDNLYLPRLHRKAKVAPDVGAAPQGAGSPGGYVLDSRPGLYHNVLVLDFKSLYPSIIRTFKIDPYGLSEPGEDPVPGFNGASFAREGAILPELIEHLWSVREAAKQAGDAPMAQAVKILMNSFYGVLGAHGCRFFDARLASSITRRGHQIIRESKVWLEEAGHEVIYGDTDSLFVLLGPEPSEEQAQAIGVALAADLNEWWSQQLHAQMSLKSCLEIEFETTYHRFFMPTVRGEQTGSKKRYAGLVRNARGQPVVLFKGLESVRTDWTPLARKFQRDLYTRIFTDEPYEAFVKAQLKALYAGQLDEHLVYRKRIRRPLEDYVTNVPPHVQAARKLDKPSRWIRYVITANGPEPVVTGSPAPRPDYDHYRARQLAPAADGILQFLDTSFEKINDAQLSIF